RNNPPASLLGSTSTLSVYSPTAFRLDNAHWRWAVSDVGYMQLEMLPAAYGVSNDEVSHSGGQAVGAEAILRTSFSGNYTGAGTLPYGNNSIGDRLSDVAQLIKMDLGTRIFTLDYQNFDTHTNQDDPGSYDNPLADLAGGLAAFMN